MLPPAPFSGCGGQPSGGCLSSCPSPFPESLPYLPAVYPCPFAVWSGSPACFRASQCHYTKVHRSEGNTGRPKQTHPSACAKQSSCPRAAKAAGGRDSKSVSALSWVAGKDVSVQHKQLFLFQRANDQVSKLAFSGIGQRLCQALARTPLFRKDSRSPEAGIRWGGEGSSLGSWEPRGRGGAGLTGWYRRQEGGPWEAGREQREGLCFWGRRGSPPQSQGPGLGRRY